MIKMALKFISCSKDCQYCCPTHARRQRDKSKVWISSIPTIDPQDLQSTVGCLALCTRAPLFCHPMPGLLITQLSWKEGSGWKPTLKPRNSWSGAAEHSQCQTLLRSFFALEKLEKPDLTIFLYQLSVERFFKERVDGLEGNSFQRRCVVQSINFPTIELKKNRACVFPLGWNIVLFIFLCVKYPIIMIWWFYFDEWI